MRAALCIFLLFIALNSYTQNINTWENAKRTGEAQLNCYWFDSEPFMYPTTDNNISGIEYDLMFEFKRYIKDEHDVDLKLNFIRMPTFSGLFDTIKTPNVANNSIGMASFSITAERSRQVSFSQPYLPDISVIVSEYSLPIAYSTSEFDSIFDNKTAITVSQTTFEEQLISLKNQLDIDYDIEYILSTSELIKKVANTPNSFGYIDLPSYLTALQDTVNVKRQYLYPLTNPGLSYILPKNSDWTEALNSFINHPNFMLSNFLIKKLT